MGLRIAVNGMDKTGIELMKSVIRNCSDIEIAAVNCDEESEVPSEYVHKQYTDKTISIDGHEIKYFNEKDYSIIPWADLDIDILIETAHNKEPYNHIKAGAKKVLLTHPDDNADISIVMGANEDMYNPERHKIISVLPPIVNCAAPILNVLHRKFCVMKANITDIHAADSDISVNKGITIEYSNTPITGYMGKILPELQGRLNTGIIKTPAQSVSLAEINAVVCKQTNVLAINEWLKVSSMNSLKDILMCSDKHTSSSDFAGDTHSAVIDLMSTSVSDGNLVRVMAWYDSESAYIQRIIDIIRYMGYYRENANNMECSMA